MMVCDAAAGKGGVCRYGEVKFLVKKMINRLVGRTEPTAAADLTKWKRPANSGGHHKKFVGRSNFAGRAGGDEDFSGETGAERRWQHRACCATD